MSEIKVVLDGAMIAEVMHSPTGPVVRHMLERAELFRQAARRQARGKSGTAARSGCLENSIVKRVEQIPDGIAIRVVSDTSPCSPDHKSYSLFVHEGTRPHRIAARNATTLAFFWEHGHEGPGMYFFPEVQHPGTAPNRFLTDNLRIFGV